MQMQFCDILSCEASGTGEPQEQRLVELLTIGGSKGT